MIPLTAIAGSVSVFLFLLWYARSKNESEMRVRSLGDHERIVVERQSAFTQRVAFPMVNGAVNTLMAILPTSLIGRARKWHTLPSFGSDRMAIRLPSRSV